MKKTLLSLTKVFALIAFTLIGTTILAQDDETEKLKKDKAKNTQLMEEGMATIDKLKAKYQAMAIEYVDMRKTLGEEHPHVLDVQKSMNGMAAEIRNLKIHMELVEPQRILKDIASDAKKLSASISKLQPLTADEQTLNEAMAHLQKALATLATKQKMQSTMQQNSSNLIRLKQAEDALLLAEGKQKLEFYEAAKANVMKNKAAAEMARYQALLDQRNAELDQMTRKVEEAKKLAEIQFIEKVQAARVVEERLASDEAQQRTDEKQAAGNRLDRMEAEISEIKVMLKEIVSKISRDK